MRPPRHRPPWWPSDVDWPPPGGMREDAWRMRGRFFRRIAVLFASFVIFTIAGATLLFWLVASALGFVDLSGTFARGVVLLVLLVGAAGFAMTARGVRRLAAPIGNVIAAAGRVEAGDYRVRVDERGPREVRALGRAFNTMAARLEASEEQRRRLLADVTHELRTPLTIVQGDLEALLDGVHPADAAHVAPILDETRVLSRLIDDLRTLALAEAGALTLHREPMDVGAVASETLASFRAQADRDGVTLVADVDDGLPIVEADPVRAREVLANLLANALRYTPAGGTVRVGVEGGEERVTVSVRDTGSGIAPDALPHIFDRFYKSPDSRGAGLGLPIAKSLVVAHGGEISARSASGEGTEIRFTLPAVR